MSGVPLSPARTGHRLEEAQSQEEAVQMSENPSLVVQEGASDVEDIQYYADMPRHRSVWMEQPLSAADMELVKQGSSKDIIKALHIRREEHFANHIEGPVRNGKLSRWLIMAYAPPSLTTVPLTVLISVYVIQFYEKVGASLGLLAFFQALARAFDVITDPTMSYVTDSFRSRHGRRRPFLLTGAPFYGLALFCLLCPWPSLGSFGVSVWFGVFYITFFLFATYCNIPYDALAPELTDNQNDRADVFFVCTMFDGLGGLAVALFPVGFGQGIDWYRTTRSEQYASCDHPDESGHVNALSAVGLWLFGGKSSAPASIAAWSGRMANASSVYGWTRDQCLDRLGPGANSSFDAQTYQADLDTWCDCSAKADLVHSLDSSRYSYAFVGLFFGIWAIISLVICVIFVKERSQLKTEDKKQCVLGKPRPLVPSILNTMQNRPFVLLLPAWTLDSLATALIGSLLTFFVRYVVQPEYSNQELYGCRPVGGADDWRCQSEFVLGVSFLAFLAGVVVFTPLWLFLSKRFGKNVIWLAWSISNGFTFLLYAFVGPGDVYLCIVMSVFNGAPAGAKFLADAIMADIIDYDEFLTGARAEATYTMFKGFLPKIAAIPASALPIALLSSFGHIPLQDGMIMKQPDSLVNFIKVVIIYVPAGLSFLSCYYKLKYPIKTAKQVDMITDGVAQHLIERSGVDPCSGLKHRPVYFTAEEQVDVDIVDNFPGVSVVQDLLDDPVAGAHKLLVQSVIHLIVALLALVIFLTAACLTFPFLDSDFSYIPVLCIVGFGTSITCVAFTSLRLHAARHLQTHLPERVSMLKLLKMRESLARLKNFSTSVCPCHSTRKRHQSVVASLSDEQNGMVELQGDEDKDH